MSKLPVVSSRDFIKYLTKKGYQYQHSTGSHHIYKLNDRIVSIPQRKEIGKGLFRALLEEAVIYNT